jgi:tetratricopeptide (TPR) repeat protein
MESRLRKPLTFVIYILIIAIIVIIALMIKDVFLERNVPQNPAEQAYAEANALVKKDPKNADYLFRRAKANSDLGRNNSAINDLQQAISLRPSAPMLHYTLAQIYITNNDDKNAIAELKSELRVTENKNELAWFDLGKLCNKYRDFQQAVFCLTNALTRMKSGADAHYELGIAYQGLGKYNLAAKEYQKVLELIPDDEAAQTALKNVLPKTTFSTNRPLLDTTNTAEKTMQKN